MRVSVLLDITLIRCANILLDDLKKIIDDIFVVNVNTLLLMPININNNFIAGMSLDALVNRDI